MQSVTIGKNQAGQRLDKFLHKYLPLAGTGFLYKMLRKKNIVLNGKRAQGSEILALNDRIDCFFSDETFSKFSGRENAAPGPQSAPDPWDQSVPEGRAGTLKGQAAEPVCSDRVRRLAEEYEAAYRRLQGIKILYEDEAVLILDKPTGILTQKAAAQDLSLNEWAAGYLLSEDPGLIQDLETFRPGVCNRLDRNTSGIVLCGKSLAGLQYLGECLKKRRIRKFYLTVCAGRLSGTVRLEGLLSKDGVSNRVSLLQSSQGPGGLPAERVPKDGSFVCTVCRPLCATDAYTLVEAELITGKTHQIRAQLAAAGHPLIGDGKYGNDSVNQRMQRLYGLRHQLLHAYKVEFPEETAGCGAMLSGRTVCSPCPETFQRLQEGLGLGTGSP